MVHSKCSEAPCVQCTSPTIQLVNKQVQFYRNASTSSSDRTPWASAQAAEPSGNWSGGAYWPSTFTGLPEDDEDPLVVQAYWAHNAAAGLDYVLEHRWKARPMHPCLSHARVPLPHGMLSAATQCAAGAVA